MDLTIPRLGAAKVRSPLKLSKRHGDNVCDFVRDEDRFLFDVSWQSVQRIKEQPDVEPLTLERAGPRQMLFFDPANIRAGIVTCGGLCPGINNVIRTLVMELHYHYGVRRIYGFRYGYAGLIPEVGHEAMNLTPEAVKNIHHDGGTILGSSRGPQDVSAMVDTLDRMDIRLFFVIGGDGSLRGAQAIYEEITRRGLKISVIAIPKTIDNDIQLVEKTFGFETAFSIAIEAIRAAHVEAEGAPNGIGLVRLMGRHSGYIAATAALAEPDVNYVLIPEVPFVLEGENGLIDWLVKRLQTRRHAVVVVAEGAGQDLFDQNSLKHDPSGNVKLGDIGLFLKRSIAQKLEERGLPHALKYIDPSYIIRSAPANPNDSLFCSSLAQNAVHAGMTGRTGILLSVWNNIMTHIPISEAICERKVIDPEGELWRSVQESTGQPF